MFCDNLVLLPGLQQGFRVLSPGSLGVQTLGLSTQVGCVGASCNIFCKITWGGLLFVFLGRQRRGTVRIKLFWPVLHLFSMNLFSLLSVAFNTKICVLQNSISPPTKNSTSNTDPRIYCDYHTV